MHRRVGPTCLYSAAQRAARGSVRRIVNLASTAGVVVGLTAVSTQAQTLTDALAEAYNTNPQLLAQRALLRATDEQVPQALSFWRPTVNFTGQMGGERSAFTPGSNGLPGPGGRSTYSTFYENSLALQVTQPVYRGGRTVAQTRQAINTVEFDPSADPRSRDHGIPSGGDGLSRRRS